MSFGNVPVFSTPYSLEFNKIKHMVTKYLPILLNDPMYQEILSKGIKSVSRRAPTLGGGCLSPCLFLSKPPSSSWLHFKGTYKCGTKGCNYCQYIKTGQCVHSSTNNKNVDIRQYINCNTKYFMSLIVNCATFNMWGIPLTD